MLLAMSTPWSIEFNKDILLFVHGNFVEVLSNENLDTLLVPVLRNLLGHQMLFQLAFEEIGHERLDIGGVECVILGLELGHLLSKSDCSEGWQFTVNNSEELQDSLVVFFVSVDSDKQHLALVLFGIFFQNSNLAFMVISSNRREEEEVGLDLSREDLLSSLMVEVHNKWKRLGGDKLGNLFFSQSFGEKSLAIIEGLDHDDTLALNSIFAADSLISGDTERNVIKVGSSREVGLGSISLSINESLGFFSIGQSLGRRSSLLLYPGNDGVSSSSTSILHWFSILEELQSWVSSNLKLLSKLTLFSGINLSKLDWRVFLCEDSSGFSILRSQGFAMSTPWSIKFYQDKFISIDSFLEVAFSKN